MLEPHSRTLLLDALRPPDGFRFDCAIGTTYSLDLVSLLMAPLAFTRFNVAATDSTLQVDPMAWLESLRRNARRIGLFCQAGQIAVPPADNRLFGFLEDAIVEVAPKPSSNGVFHPKVWALRFVDDDDTVSYRLLCMSRNLTFDRSWDTMLVLDGVVNARRGNRKANEPLGEFFAALPRLATRPVPEHVMAHTELIQREIRSVEFELPTPFTDLRFWPLGIEASKANPFPRDYDRVMVVSPFVSVPTLLSLADQTRKSVLISRQQELDRFDIGETDFASVYTLSDGADPEPTEAPQEAASGIADEVVEIAASDAAALTGLHAKLYMFEYGQEVRIYTGSANATDAALGVRKSSGINVEFLVELVTDKRNNGIDVMLRRVQGETHLMDMLQEYRAPDSPVERTLVEKLDDLVSDARRVIAASQYTCTVSQVGDRYTVDITLTGDGLPALGSDITVTCWPVTFSDANAIALPLKRDAAATFENVSYEALTTFVAVRIAIERDGVTASTCFAMNLPVIGMPADREQRLLLAMLSDRGRFLRFLLMLLKDDGSSFGPGAGAGSSGGVVWGSGLSSTALLESLIQTFDRGPEKLDQIDRLVCDLRRTPEGMQILPDNFLDVWEPIWEARQTTRGVVAASQAQQASHADDVRQLHDLVHEDEMSSDTPLVPISDVLHQPISVDTVEAHPILSEPSDDSDVGIETSEDAAEWGKAEATDEMKTDSDIKATMLDLYRD